MKNLILFIALLPFTAARAQTEKPVKADAILHIWQTEEKDGAMQILKDGNKYYGKMLYGKRQLEADGTYKKDIHNPDPALRSRLLKEYVLISGLVYQDDKWVGGKIYDYENGNSYDVNLELKGNTMYMRAFKGVPMFGKTVKWALVK